jgi:hypothetical protein
MPSLQHILHIRTRKTIMSPLGDSEKTRTLKTHTCTYSISGLLIPILRNTLIWNIINLIKHRHSCNVPTLPRMRVPFRKYIKYSINN